MIDDQPHLGYLGRLLKKEKHLLFTSQLASDGIKAYECLGIERQESVAKRHLIFHLNDFNSGDSESLRLAALYATAWGY